MPATPKVIDGRGSVYFIQDDKGRVKIGWTRDIRTRLMALQSGTLDNLALLRVVDGSKTVERWFHKRFAKHRIRGEWFAFASEMLTIAAPDEVPQRRTIRVRAVPTKEGFYAAAAILGLTEDSKLASALATVAEAGQ